MFCFDSLGYTSYKVFENCFNKLSKTPLQIKSLTASPASIVDFISRNKKVAAIEIASVYDITFDKAVRLLKQISEKGMIRESPEGNGFFIYCL